MAEALSSKRLAISKANAQMVGIVGIAAFLTVFSLIAAHALWNQNTYLGRLVAVKEKAHKQLQTNLINADDLVTAYKKFTTTPINAIGGSTAGTGNNDGDNAKLVLDALPSSYDFPALTTSIEKILTSRNFKVDTITGTDDELAQSAGGSTTSPQPVPMAFSFDVSGANYAQIQDLIGALQSSIRPLQVDTLTLSGGTSNMKLSVTAHTYYQPAKAVSITKQAVK